ncbi:MAG TPA: hypothetical protein VGW33_05545 [Terriglobia bacterium]|nr:hypothetical protein [Terriglobia bacterium]
MNLAAHTTADDSARQFLRHTVATLAYRGAKALRGAPAGFAEFRLPDRIATKTRTPGEILAHLGDLLDWALSMAQGQEEWHNSPVLPWEQGSERFFKALEAFDACLASDQPLAAPPERLFQGAIADSLTHVGQIGMLRRLAGAPVRGENYSRAEIVAGRVGPEQAPPGFEFD